PHAIALHPNRIRLCLQAARIGVFPAVGTRDRGGEERGDITRTGGGQVCFDGPLGLRRERSYRVPTTSGTLDFDPHLVPMEPVVNRQPVDDLDELLAQSACIRDPAGTDARSDRLDQREVSVVGIADSRHEGKPLLMQRAGALVVAGRPATAAARAERPRPELDVLEAFGELVRLLSGLFDVMPKRVCDQRLRTQRWSIVRQLERSPDPAADDLVVRLPDPHARPLDGLEDELRVYIRR